MKEELEQVKQTLSLLKSMVDSGETQSVTSQEMCLKAFRSINKALDKSDENISLVRAKKYAKHQHFLGTQQKELVEFEDWVDNG